MVIEDPKRTPKLKPAFETEPDISNEPQQIVFSNKEKEVIEEAVPHFFILKERYSKYKNPDPEGKSDGIPADIARLHELDGFKATLSQAHLEKNLQVTPTRLIKCFVYEDGKRNAYLIVDKNIQGEKVNGDPTNICNVRTGYYRYPTKFQQDGDGEWRPIKFQRMYDIPFTKDTATKFANMGNPHTKKYAVWHPDGTRRGHYRLAEDFIGKTDDEQIADIEAGKI